MLEESPFAAGEIRLLDEDFVAGTLSEAAGEPTVIQGVDEDSFAGVRFAFFAGSASFAARHCEAAQRAGATVIDLSGGLANLPFAFRWIPSLDAVLPPPGKTGRPTDGRLVISPTTPAVVACSLAVCLQRFSPARLAFIFFQPVSERGEAGVEELESQTVKLLSFQPAGQEVFDTQVAFNLVDRYGAASAERLADARARIACEVRSYLDGRAPLPAIQLVQAPVFYSHAFSAYLEFGSASDSADLEAELGRAMESAGVKRVPAGDPQPSNVIAAGEDRPLIGAIERDPNVERAYWLWGAADNLRVAAANAARIAEKLLAS